MKKYANEILEEVVLKNFKGRKEKFKIEDKIVFSNPEDYKFLEEKFIYQSLERKKDSYGEKIDIEKIKENYRQEINLERDFIRNYIKLIKDEIGNEPYKIKQILPLPSILFLARGKQGKEAFVNGEYFTKYKN